VKGLVIVQTDISFLKFDWSNTEEPISKDKLRIALKKTFIETTT